MQYKIQGDPMPVVICQLAPGETMITESGSMVWMSPGFQMETAAGGVGKAFGRMFTGESVFQNYYTAPQTGGMIAFGASFVGAIRAVEITPDRPIIAQKRAFLASTSGVELSTFFQKRAAAGFFGGEGFIMQRLSGSGIAFLEVDGTAVEYDLAAGQQLLVSTGNLALCDASCSIDIQAVKGLKNKLLGGEGFFNTVVTGPGRITLQTMSLQQFASTVAAYIPKGNG